MAKNCDNCINSGRPSYEYPCTVCETAYGSAPSKWESVVSATADMVEVVRCKDCKHAGINENHPKKPLLCYLTRMCGTVDPEWYCWQGERKNNESSY